MGIAIQKTTAVSRVVEELRRIGGMESVELAKVVNVLPQTVRLWSEGRSLPTIEKQQAIADLRWIAERLSDFYKPDEMRLWLQTSHPQLNGEKPCDLVNGGRAGEVLEVIDRLESGVYL